MWNISYTLTLCLFFTHEKIISEICEETILRKRRPFENFSAAHWQKHWSMLFAIIKKVTCTFSVECSSNRAEWCRIRRKWGARIADVMCTLMNVCTSRPSHSSVVKIVTDEQVSNVTVGLYQTVYILRTVYILCLYLDLSEGEYCPQTVWLTFCSAHAVQRVGLE